MNYKLPKEIEDHLRACGGTAEGDIMAHVAAALCQSLAEIRDALRPSVDLVEFECTDGSKAFISRGMKVAIHAYDRGTTALHPEGFYSAYILVTDSPEAAAAKLRGES